MPIYTGTRVFLFLITYLVVLQIIKPLLDSCPFGSCIFSRLPRITFTDPCAPQSQGAPCSNPSKNCYSYEYAPCPGRH